MTGSLFIKAGKEWSLQATPPSQQQWESVLLLVGKRISACTHQLLHKRGYRIDYKEDGTLAVVRHVTVDATSRVFIFDSASQDYTHLDARLAAVNGVAPQDPQDQMHAIMIEYVLP